MPELFPTFTDVIKKHGKTIKKSIIIHCVDQDLNSIEAGRSRDLVSYVSLELPHRTRKINNLYVHVKSNQIEFICHKFSTQYNNEFALRLAGQTGDNFALMSARVQTMTATVLLYKCLTVGHFS